VCRSIPEAVAKHILWMGDAMHGPPVFDRSTAR